MSSTTAEATQTYLPRPEDTPLLPKPAEKPDKLTERFQAFNQVLSHLDQELLSIAPEDIGNYDQNQVNALLAKIHTDNVPKELQRTVDESVKDYIKNEQEMTKWLAETPQEEVLKFFNNGKELHLSSFELVRDNGVLSLIVPPTEFARLVLTGVDTKNGLQTDDKSIKDFLATHPHMGFVLEQAPQGFPEGIKLVIATTKDAVPHEKLEALGLTFEKTLQNDHFSRLLDKLATKDSELTDRERVREAVFDIYARLTDGTPVHNLARVGISREWAQAHPKDAQAVMDIIHAVQDELGRVDQIADPKEKEAQRKNVLNTLLGSFVRPENYLKQMYKDHPDLKGTASDEFFKDEDVVPVTQEGRDGRFVFVTGSLKPGDAITLKDGRIFVTGRKLGEGSFKTVYEGFDPTGNEVAILELVFRDGAEQLYGTYKDASGNEQYLYEKLFGELIQKHRGDPNKILADLFKYMGKNGNTADWSEFSNILFSKLMSEIFKLTEPAKDASGNFLDMFNPRSTQNHPIYKRKISWKQRDVDLQVFQNEPVDLSTFTIQWDDPATGAERELEMIDPHSLQKTKMGAKACLNNTIREALRYAATSRAGNKLRTEIPKNIDDFVKEQLMIESLTAQGFTFTPEYIGFDETPADITNGVGPEYHRIVMIQERIKGRDLNQELKAGKHFTTGEVLDIATKLCTAIGELHADSKLHNDIKPENIIIDAQGKIRLIDAGSFTLAGERASSTSFVYASPETLRLHRSNQQTDIYMISTTLAELLTGFDIEALPPTYDETVDINNPPPGGIFLADQDANDRRIQAIETALKNVKDSAGHRTVPDELINVITKGLAYHPDTLGQLHPDDRYPNLATMQAELLRVGADIIFNEKINKADKVFILPPGFVTSTDLLPAGLPTEITDLFEGIKLQIMTAPTPQNIDALLQKMQEIPDRVWTQLNPELQATMRSIATKCTIDSLKELVQQGHLPAIQDTQLDNLFAMIQKDAALPNRFDSQMQAYCELLKELAFSPNHDIIKIIERLDSNNNPNTNAATREAIKEIIDQARTQGNNEPAIKFLPLLIDKPFGVNTNLASATELVPAAVPAEVTDTVTQLVEIAKQNPTIQTITDVMASLDNLATQSFQLLDAEVQAVMNDVVMAQAQGLLEQLALQQNVHIEQAWLDTIKKRAESPNRPQLETARKRKLMELLHILAYKDQSATALPEIMRAAANPDLAMGVSAAVGTIVDRTEQAGQIVDAALLIPMQERALEMSYQRGVDHNGQLPPVMENHFSTIDQLINSPTQPQALKDGIKDRLQEMLNFANTEVGPLRDRITLFQAVQSRLSLLP